MPTNSGRKKSANGPGSIEVNPVVVAVVALVLVVGLGWFFWLRPQREAEQTAREWTSPAAAAARAPENRPKDAAHEAAVQRLLQSEGHADRAQPSRRDER